MPHFGISRTRYYEWKKVADRYGLEALMPKTRRRAQLPKATPTHVIEDLLTLAVLEPTLGLAAWPTGSATRLAPRAVHGPEKSPPPAWAAAANAWPGPP